MFYIAPLIVLKKGENGLLINLGTELFQSMLDHYLPRYQLAFERGYTEEGSQYYWLYIELKERILAIRQAQKFLHALPLFMQQGNEEQSLQYVVSYVSTLCAQLAAENQEQGSVVSSVNRAEDPYWLQANEVWSRMQEGYDMNNLPLLYLDLSEYLVRALRFYLHMREQQRTIDRDKFDAIMQLNLNQAVT